MKKVLRVFHLLMIKATVYYDMIPILRAIAKTQPLTYVGDENSPHNKSFEHEKNNIICKTILNKS